MSYDAFTALPTIDLPRVLDMAMTTKGALAFWAGGGALALGLIWRGAAELKRATLDDEKPRYAQLLIEAAAVAALMHYYQPFVTGTIRLVSGLFEVSGGGASFDVAFARRLVAYHEWDVQHDRTGAMGLMTPSGFTTSLLSTTTQLLHIAVQAIAFVLRVVQKFGLAVVVVYGPVVIGLSFCSRFLLPLGIGWFWALVELSAWSVTMDVLLSAFGESMGAPTEFSLPTELLLSMAMVLFMVAVPVLTSALVRSQAVGQIGQSAAMGIYAAGWALGRPRSVMSKGKAAMAAGKWAASTRMVRGSAGALGSWLGSKMAGQAASSADAAPTGHKARGGTGLAQQAVSEYMAKATATKRAGSGGGATNQAPQASSASAGRAQQGQAAPRTRPAAPNTPSQKAAPPRGAV